MEISIVDQNGWSKKIHVERSIARIGSMPGSDAQITSPSGDAIQIQLFIDPQTPSVCKLLCLAGLTEIVRDGGSEIVPSYGSFDLLPFDQIVIAGHTITIELPAPSVQNNHFAAALTLAEPDLSMGRALTWRLKVQNLGDRSACQFQVSLKGLPKDCYQIESIPLMYPDSEEEVSIRFFHHGTYPKLGLNPIMLCVTSDMSYPGEEIVLEKLMRVAPVFAYDVELNDDFAAGRSTGLPVEDLPEEVTAMVEEKTEAVVPEEGSGIETASTANEQPLDLLDALESVLEPLDELAKTPRKEKSSKAKVFSNTDSDFWNEEEL